MPYTLTQRPGSVPQLDGNTVLHIDPSQGGAVLLHDLMAAQSMLHVRLMFALSASAEGQLTIAGGIADAGQAIWQLRVDATSRAISLTAGDQTIAAALPTAFDWHTVEVGLDQASNSATLRLNGIERASASMTLAATRQAWLGGAFASQDFTGTIDLDHWVLSDEPIGLPASAPMHDHAGDARRWLVVYNRDVPDSCAWADIYRDRRGIPYANLCGLDLPTSETISAGAFETFRQQISDYLDDNGLREQVVGVLLGFGVPGYADVAGQDMLKPIASYLHTDDTHGLPVVNPLYQPTISARPAASDFIGVRLTGRIDAPTLAEAVALIDRADALVDEPLTRDQLAELVFDINRDNPTVSPLQTQPIAAWAEGLGLASLRLPARVYDSDPPSTVSGEAVVWGWRDSAPSAGFFAEPAGRRAICMQFNPQAQPAVTVRSASATDWLGSALQAGYAYAAAPSGLFSLSSLPMPHLFFEALRRGWTVAESWLVSQAFLRDGLQLVGDPLMPIPFPKAGYDIFGPASRLDQIDFDAPVSKRHAGERVLHLDASQLPSDGASTRYLVRRIDTAGRSDRAAASAFVAIIDGQPVQPAIPAWPTDDAWPVLQRKGRLELMVIWPASLRSMGVDTVQLVAQVNDSEPVTLQTVTPATGQRRVTVVIDRPTEPTRYRFTSLQGTVSFHTPWSVEVVPAPPPSQSITLLEAFS